MSPLRRVACATLCWASALIATLLFDQLARAAGWAPPNSSREPEGPSDWLSSLGVAVALLAIVLGSLVGLVAPSRPCGQSRDGVDESILMSQLWRRSFVAAVVGGAAVGAVTGGLVSVTTDISGDDSASTVGSVGGLLYGAVLGIVLGIVGGFVVALIGMSRLLPFRSRVVALVLTAASAVSTSVVFVCFIIFVPGSGALRQMPGAIAWTIVLTSAIGALTSSPYLVGWYIRLCTSAGPAASSDRPGGPELRA